MLVCHQLQNADASRHLFYQAVRRHKCQKGLNRDQHPALGPRISLLAPLQVTNALLGLLPRAPNPGHSEDCESEAGVSGEVVGAGLFTQMGGGDRHRMLVRNPEKPKI